MSQAWKVGRTGTASFPGGVGQTDTGKLWHCDPLNWPRKELNLRRGLVVWRGSLGPSPAGTESCGVFLAEGCIEKLAALQWETGEWRAGQRRKLGEGDGQGRSCPVGRYRFSPRT